MVLTLTGLLGFLIGTIRFSTWQVAVEGAQVVAGLVEYPPDNPFYIYQLNLWTVLHQICALLLRAGLSEITVSHLVSGALGMISFQAIGLLIYAFSSDLLLAIGAPLLMLYTRAAEHGSTYPVVLMGTTHTYGAVGLSLIVLVVALLGPGWYRLGGFLVGLAPAVHPSLGAWLGLIVFVCVLWDFKGLRAQARLALPYIIAGCAVTALSLVVQQAMASHIARLDSAVSARYIAGFIRGWDEHRRTVPVVSTTTTLNALALAISLVWLKAFRSDLPRHAIFALRAIAAAAGLSLILMFVSWIPTDVVPPALLVLMPSRYLNFNVLAFLPVVIGLLALYRHSFWSELALALLFAALFVNARSMLWQSSAAAMLARFPHLDPQHIFIASSLALVCVSVASRWTWRLSSTVAAIPRTVTLALLGVTAVLVWRVPPSSPLLDRTNDPIFAAAAAERKGLLLTSGSFHLVQLYTRRPVLIDGGALDTLMYAPEGGPVMERILRDAYDIDFFNPPAEVKRSAWIPHSFNEPAWEGFSRQRWHEIGRTLDVTQVLTRANYALDLPIVAEDGRFKLYVIPGKEESGPQR